ncbi:hypothetical protein [uncultured Desulfobacter sp.]|uniref:hypothetical protein n=1 Tax=uncultured Desulfobacter sp. TaxID=240139 RepID=UPI002AAC3691|nr:hypothetical protein [uncultured Desulfobacter sp.]
MIVRLTDSVGKNTCYPKPNWPADEPDPFYYYDGDGFRTAANSEVAADLGLTEDNEDVIPITQSLFDRLGWSEAGDITSPFEFVKDQVSDYTPLQFGNYSGVYLYTDDTLWQIRDPETYALLGFNTGDCVTPDWSLVRKFSGYPPSGMVGRSGYSTTIQFLVTHSAPIPFKGMAATVVEAIGPKTCTPLGSKENTAKVYYFDGNQFRWIQTPEAYFGLGYPQWNFTVPITQDLFDRYGEGDAIAVPEDAFEWNWMPFEAVVVVSDINDLWGFAADDVYAVGETDSSVPKGVLYHYDGCQWHDLDLTNVLATASLPPLKGVWCGMDANVFVVGEQGTILQFDGTQWRRMISPTEEGLNAVWGLNDADVYAVGDNGTIIHYDGSTWQIMIVQAKMDFQGIWGNSPSDLDLIGKIDEIASPSPILHFDGSSWTPQELPLPAGTDGNLDLYGIWGATGGPVLAVGEKGIIVKREFEDDQWQLVRAPEETRCSPDYLDIWGYTPDDLFMTWMAGYYYFFGTKHQCVATESVLHFDGTDWRRMSMTTLSVPWLYPRELKAVWGSKDGHVFTAGPRGQILHYQRPRSAGAAYEK